MKPSEKDGPYKVEVEQERPATVRTLCITGPDGVARGRFFECIDNDAEVEEAAQDECDLLNEGYRAGLERAAKECESRRGSFMQASAGSIAVSLAAAIRSLSDAGEDA